MQACHIMSLLTFWRATHSPSCQVHEQPPQTLDGLYMLIPRGKQFPLWNDNQRPSMEPSNNKGKENKATVPGNKSNHMTFWINDSTTTTTWVDSSCCFKHCWNVWIPSLNRLTIWWCLCFDYFWHCSRANRGGKACKIQGINRFITKHEVKLKKNQENLHS